jgi:hypothetical protein
MICICLRRTRQSISKYLCIYISIYLYIYIDGIAQLDGPSVIAAILNVATGELGARDLKYASARKAAMTVVLEVVLAMHLHVDDVHNNGEALSARWKDELVALSTQAAVDTEPSVSFIAVSVLEALATIKEPSS